MEDVFVIDIDNLYQIADLSNNAEIAINEVSERINELLSHEDWHCKEKDIIDEDISRIKKTSVLIQETFTNFAVAVRTTANRYIEMVNEEKRDLLEIDQQIGKLMALLNGSVDIGVNVSGSNVVDIAASINTNWNGPFESNAIYNINQPIQVVAFSDVFEGINSGS